MMDLSVIGRHVRVALAFSGGKDSLACAYILRPLMDRITIYHMDTGDLLPEVMDIVEHVKSFWPSFVHVRGDVRSWISIHGMPTDLLPHGSHIIGRGRGDESVPLVPRYDCCFANLMLPIHERIKADGNTLVIRGTKIADMNRLPARSGDCGDGVEILLPLQDWSDGNVFDYLRSVGAPINRLYEHTKSSPECARCTAWWSEGRAEYLKQFHPALFSEYASGMRALASAVDGPLQHLRREMSLCENAT